MSDGSRLDAPRAAAITVRPGHPGDRRFVLEATRRLAAFGTPPGRTSEEIVEGEARTLRAFFDTASPPETLLIAEIEEDPCGFVFLEEKQDYFTGGLHGHIGILVVSAHAEGSGVGGALMAAAERWSRDRGYASLTLNVFDGNRRARGVYEHAGFRPDTVKYRKLL